MSALVITHTRAEGTLIDGTSRGDGSSEVLKANGWRWGRSIGMWFVPQSRDRAIEGRIDRIIGLTRAALEADGFAVEVEIDDTPRPTAVVEAEKVARQESRVEALESKADRKRQVDDAAWSRAQTAHDSLPPGGEPIKVGHHSEGRHRAAIDRADRAMRASVEATRAADEAERRAETATHTTGARYAPEVVERRIKRLEAEERKYGRALTGYTDRYGSVIQPASGEYKERFSKRRAEILDQIEYWRGVIA